MRRHIFSIMLLCVVAIIMSISAAAPGYTPHVDGFKCSEAAFISPEDLFDPDLLSEATNLNEGENRANAGSRVCSEQAGHYVVEELLSNSPLSITKLHVLTMNSCAQYPKRKHTVVRVYYSDDAEPDERCLL